MSYRVFFRRLAPLLLLASVQAAPARMYQWIEPHTGTTQLSGKPPVWYRSGQPGPRVLVFDNGHLIDDTAIKVEAEARRRLRQEALAIAEEDG